MWVNIFLLTTMTDKKKKRKEGGFFLQLLSICVCLHYLGSFQSYGERKEPFQRALSHTCNLSRELPSLSTDYSEILGTQSPSQNLA